MAEHQTCNGTQHQYKAETQLRFQGDDFHQPGVQEDGDEDPGVKKGEGVTHAGNGQVEILCDISHHHPGDDNQRTGKGVGEEADPCELDTIAVSHDWPVNRNVKRPEGAASGQILSANVI